MKIQRIKIIFTKWRLSFLRTALVVGLLLMTGCISVPNIPIFGSKPPVASPGKSKPAGRNRTVQPSPEVESAVPANSHSRELPKASQDKTAVSGNQASTVTESASPPAPIKNILGGEDVLPEYNQDRPLIIEKADVDFVAGRLDSYRQKMTDWNELAGGLVKLDMGGAWPDGWYGCVQNLEMVFAGYRRLWKDVSNDSSSAGASAVYQRDVEYLESSCDELMAVGQGEISRKMAGFKDTLTKQAGNLIQQYIGQGQNIAASQAYENFIQIYGNAAATDKMKMLYSKALMRQGRLEAALAPLADIWGKEVNASAYDRGRTAGKADLAGTQGLLSVDNLGVAYADLLLANNKPEAARKIYAAVALNFNSDRDLEVWVNNQQQILSKGENSSLLDAYVEILRSFYRFNGTAFSHEFADNLEKINNNGSNALSANTKIIAHKVAVLVGSRIDEQLAKIDELIGGREFDQARSMADKLVSFVAKNNDVLLSSDHRAEVAALQDRIDEAATSSSKDRLQLDKQRAERQWQTAVDLLDRREYKAAIGTFSQLLTSEYGPDARAKMSEAANMKAVETRREAANLFFKARKTHDPQLKKQLLMQSRDLLRQVVAEYPDVEIIDKIKRNIQVLDEQLNGDEVAP